MEISSLLSTPGRLSRGVLDSSIVEALVSPNPVERYIGMIDPTWSRRDVRAKIVNVERQTPRSATLTLEPNSNWSGFKAGQHVGVTVEIDGVLTTRYYSPASAEGSKKLELTITAHPGGKVSQHLVSNAAPGMVVGLSPAEGDFVLGSELPENLLLISGGSGITPVMSILRTLCEEGIEGSVTFLHFARAQRDLIYESELKELARKHTRLNVIMVFTRSSAHHGQAGHLTRKQLQKVAPDFAESEAFVCGPDSLVTAAQQIWEKQGIAENLHSEPFTLPEPTVVTEDAVGSVHFTRSGVEVDNDGQSLLLQAEQGSLSPRNGCRMGICHTCVCRVESGTVRHVRTGEVKTVNNELVQICVNAPVGDLTIDL
jgi:ferredoxin-NADP reductase